VPEKERHTQRRGTCARRRAAAGAWKRVDGSRGAGPAHWFRRRALPLWLRGLGGRRRAVGAALTAPVDARVHLCQLRRVLCGRQNRSPDRRERPTSTRRRPFSRSQRPPHRGQRESPGPGRPLQRGAPLAIGRLQHRRKRRCGLLRERARRRARRCGQRRGVRSRSRLACALYGRRARGPRPARVGCAMGSLCCGAPARSRSEEAARQRRGRRRPRRRVRRQHLAQECLKLGGSPGCGVQSSKCRSKRRLNHARLSCTGRVRRRGGDAKEPGEVPLHKTSRVVPCSRSWA